MNLTLTHQNKMSSSSNNPGGHFILCLSCIQLYKIYILHKMDCSDIMICCFQLDSESISMVRLQLRVCWVELATFMANQKSQSQVTLM
ncbi:hypothetical protein CsSME_00033270 [Camellia sinensis var. sinensis]